MSNDDPFDLPADVARQVMEIVAGLINARFQWCMTNPPVAPGFHRHIRRDTRQGCACAGSSVLTEQEAAGVWNIRECECTTWVTRDYPNDGKCPKLDPWIGILHLNTEPL